jgi:hypothetical protein
VCLKASTEPHVHRKFEIFWTSIASTMACPNFKKGPKNVLHPLGFNDRTEALQLPFWPFGKTTGKEVSHQVMPPSAIVDENILAQPYWGPRSMRPSGQRIRQEIVRQNRPQTICRRGRTGVETLPQDNHARMFTSHVQERSPNAFASSLIYNRF